MKKRTLGNFSLCFLLVVAAPIATLAQTSPTAVASPAPIGKLIDVGGYRVHLYCTGTGSPTVVIVGAGYSFDWGLVQPEVAKFTQVCSYDHSGTAWSDPGPKDSCSLRVSEVHTALKNAGIPGPYILVGHSLGGLVARLYAGQYPNEVAGVVFVDHALAMLSRRRRPTDGATVAPAPPPPSPTAPPGEIRIVHGVEDNPNFSKLSVRDRELHLWATSQPPNQTALQDSLDMSMDCAEQADAIIQEQNRALREKPLVDVTANTTPSLPPPVAQKWHDKYEELQIKLLSLSLNSKRLIAENSGHFILIDRPDVVIDAISQVVQSVRNSNKL